MSERNFKYKSLKIYASNEWLYDSKKYRQVYDTNETRYIYSEFAFYNKCFDEKEWEADIQLRAFQVKSSTRKELCKLESKRTIRPDENIVFIREGWGMEKAGAFWKEGVYCWEAMINGELIATTYFYVYDVGMVTPQENPYLEIKSVKLYEGPEANLPKEERRSFVEFNPQDARFIWVDFEVINKLPKEWMCELIFNFYNDAHQLKGSSIRLQKLQPNELFSFETGWGSDAAGTWFEDNFTLEILFMDVLIAIIPFTMGNEYVEGNPPILSPHQNLLSEAPNASSPEKVHETLEQLLAKLHGLTGLENIKKQVSDYIQYIDFLKLRKEKGLENDTSINLHSVFTGNPGTGKTTVATLLGKLYHKMGLLSKGHVVEVDRAGLVAEYIGQTAPKVKEVIDKARGGILFIDEAYALYRSGEDTKDFGREVIEILLKEMSDGKGDIAIFMAGYPKEMEVFLNSNPGLKSRIGSTYDFKDYTPQELQAIAEEQIKKNKLVLTKKGSDALYKCLVEAFRKRDRTFGNARYALNAVSSAKMHMGLRLMTTEDKTALTTKELSTITHTDIEQAFKTPSDKILNLPIDNDLLKEALAELHALTGLQTVKKEVEELVKLVKYYKEEGKNVLNKFSLHTVFVGNPGTGKTTVARVLAKIYKALGIIERGELVECDREQLVGGFVGQTATKTAEVIDKAKGGVLFIDEAYTLSGGLSGDYGREAIETLLKRMEDMRGELIVIVAGYPDKMRDFLESNPGLKSRFDKKLEFEDYSEADLFSIAQQMLSKEGIKPDKPTLEYLKKYFNGLYQNRNKYFGNARAVRKVIEDLIKMQNLRMASIPAEGRTKQVKSALTMDDVKHLDAGKDPLLEGGKSGKIGFQ